MSFKKVLIALVLIAGLFFTSVQTSVGNIRFGNAYAQDYNNENPGGGSKTGIADFQSYSINGYAPFSKDTFDNAKITVVYFWATWCGPCIDELYTIQQVADSASNDYQIVTVLYDSSSSGAVDLALGIMNANELTFPVYGCTASFRQAFSPFIDFTTQALPTSVLVYQGGYHYRNVSGVQSYGTWMATISTAISSYNSSIISGVCGAQGDNLVWSLTLFSGIMQISGVGEMMDFDFETAPWYEYRSCIEQIIIDDGVTSIGEWAFNGCLLLSTIALPDSIEHIRSEALSGTSIASLFIPRNVVCVDDIFESCLIEEFIVDQNNNYYSSVDGVLFDKNLSTILRFPPKKAGSYVVPEGVSSIGHHAFLECDNLESVSFPNSVTRIDSWAFTFSLLSTIELPNNLEYIEAYAFSEGSLEGELTIPASVNYIGNQAFLGCFLDDVIFLGGVPEHFGNEVFGYSDSFIIFYTASHADEWAPNGETEWNGYPIQMIVEPIIAGDADGNGQVTSIDALLVLRAALALVEPTPEMLAACDFDGDGALSSVEALLILRYALGLIPPPTITPQPDPIVSLTWLQLDSPISCDLDFDGIADTVELLQIESSGSNLVFLKVTNGSTGQLLTDSLTCDAFVNGLIYNFNTGDHRVEILLSLSSGTRDDVIIAYRLNSESNGLIKCTEPGLVDSVTDNTFKINRLLDLLGTWQCSASFTFDRQTFSLEPKSDWIVQPEEGRWCTAAHDFIAGIYIDGSDNTALFFCSGTRLYPISTDLSGRMDFLTDTGLRGFLEITVDSAGRVLTVNGYDPDYLFSDLAFIQ